MAVVLNVTFRDGIGIFWWLILPSTPKGVAVSFIWGIGVLKMMKSSFSHYERSFVRGQICWKQKSHTLWTKDFLRDNLLSEPKRGKLWRE